MDFQWRRRVSWDAFCEEIEGENGPKNRCVSVLVEEDLVIENEEAEQDDEMPERCDPVTTFEDTCKELKNRLIRGEDECGSNNQQFAEVGAEEDSVIENKGA